MKLLIPPPLQVLIFGLVGYGTAWIWPDWGFASLAIWSIGIALIFVGVVLLAIAGGLFRKAGTTVTPIKPEKTQVLVTHGLYKFSRNPMYLAMACVLLGAVLMMQNYAALIAPVLFIISMNVLQIGPEEQVLSRKFGASYEAYRQNVRRWI